jgi:fucose permease
MHEPDETTPLRPDARSSGYASSPTAAPIRFKVASTTLCFIVLGLFTSTVGAVLASLEAHYGLSDRQASCVFLAVVGGYTAGAQLNDAIHARLGQRGVALLGPIAHVVSAVGVACHPPSYPVLLCFVALGTFGNGVLDGSWSSWAGGLERASTISGLLHGAFSVGAAVGPALIGALLSSPNGHWYQWYYVLTAISLVELGLLSAAFRDGTAEKYQSVPHRDDDDEHRRATSVSPPVLQALKYRVVWACAVYLLLYVGFESAISGWIVVFMARQRGASKFLAGVSSSGFWSGMAIGRLALGAVADRYGIKRALTVYHGVAMGLVLLFMLVRGAVVSALVMLCLGVACGPLFPSAIVYLVMRLPEELHVFAVSSVCSMGQIGGALLPALIGLVADSVGMQAFQGIILAQLVAVSACWLVLTIESAS